MSIFKYLTLNMAQNFTELLPFDNAFYMFHQRVNEVTKLFHLHLRFVASLNSSTTSSKNRRIQKKSIKEDKADKQNLIQQENRQSPISEVLDEENLETTPNFKVHPYLLQAAEYCPFKNETLESKVNDEALYPKTKVEPGESKEQPKTAVTVVQPWCSKYFITVQDLLITIDTDIRILFENLKKSTSFILVLSSYQSNIQEAFFAIQRMEFFEALVFRQFNLIYMVKSLEIMLVQFENTFNSIQLHTNINTYFEEVLSTVEISSLKIPTTISREFYERCLFNSMKYCLRKAIECLAAHYASLDNLQKQLFQHILES